VLLVGLEDIIGHGDKLASFDLQPCLLLRLAHGTIKRVFSIFEMPAGELILACRVSRLAKKPMRWEYVFN
jgi:hypothetical protein